MDTLEFSLTTLHLTLQTDTQLVQKHCNIIIWKNNNKLTSRYLGVNGLDPPGYMNIGLHFKMTKNIFSKLPVSTFDPQVNFPLWYTVVKKKNNTKSAGNHILINSP